MGRRREMLASRQAAMRERWGAGRGTSRPGRPARHLDRDQAFILALHGVPQAEIAARFGCDRKTLVRHCGAALRRAAERRAQLLPRALWQRGANTVANLVRMVDDADLGVWDSILAEASTEGFSFDPVCWESGLSGTCDKPLNSANLRKKSTSSAPSERT